MSGWRLARKRTRRTQPRRARSFFLLRHLGAARACLGKPDRDRLLAALHLLAGAAAAQRARVSLLHRPLDLLGGPLAVFSLLRLLGHRFLQNKKAGTVR